MERETQEEILIDIPELFALYLRRAFWIIGISLICAILFMGIRGLKEKERFAVSPNVLPGGEVSEEEKAKLEEAEEKIAATEYYLLRLKLEKERLSEERAEYTNSYLLSLSKSSVYERQMELFLKLEGSSFEENVDSSKENALREALVESYISRFQSGEFYEEIAKSTEGLKPSDIPDILFLNANIKAGTISLVFSGKEEADVQKMGDAAIAYWKKAEAELQEGLGAHTLYPSLDSITKGMGTHPVLNFQSETGSSEREQSSIVKRQEEKKRSIDSLTKTVEELEKAKPNPESAEISSSTKGVSKKYLLNQGLIGAFLGGFLSVFFFTVCYLLEKRLPREEDLETLYGLTVLGSMKRYNGKGLFHSLSEKFSGDLEREKDEEALLSLAKTNLSLLLKEKGVEEDLLIVSEKKELSEKAASFMRDESPYLNCSAVYDIFKNEESIQKLGKYKAIVFVAEGKSDFHTLLNMKRRCEVLDKTIVGIILY